MECSTDDEKQLEMQLFIKLTKLLLKQQRDINILRNQLQYILLKSIKIKMEFNMSCN